MMYAVYQYAGSTVMNVEKVDHVEMLPNGDFFLHPDYEGHRIAAANMVGLYGKRSIAVAVSNDIQPRFAQAWNRGARTVREML